MKPNTKNYMKWLPLLVFLLMAQAALAQRTITGTVTDAGNGEPLIGANVLVAGTSSGAVTDFDGKYSVSVPEGYNELIFSYTGYNPTRVQIGASDVMDIQLEAGEVLDEVVVVGYGAVQKRDLTGAVASLKEEDFVDGAITSPDQLLQGKVSGVQFLNNSGQPGGAATLRIRGNASVRTGNQPLYVVDGIPLDGRNARPGANFGLGDNTPGANPLNFINPNDIQSIEILKDASAAAIYGARGANGVVLITTKRGKTGDPTIQFNVSGGVSDVLKEYDVLDGDEYRDALQQYGLSGGDFGDNVDAFDEITRTGTIQDYNFSISGGNQNGNYRVSAGYFDQAGIIDESGFEKFTGSINGSYRFLESKRLRLDFNLLAAHTIEDIAPISTNAGFEGSLVGQALQWNPTQPLFNPDGTLFIERGGSQINPLGMLAAHDDQANITTVLGSISPSFEIIDGLTYRFLYSINQQVGERRASVKSFLNIQGIEDLGQATIANNTLTTQQFTHTLSYNTDLTSAINLDAVIGYEYMDFRNQGSSMTGRGFVTDDIDLTNIIQSTNRETRAISSFADPTNELQSFFGRANFNFADRYLFTATVRADGSSKFGEDNKYGVFPSFAAAWNIHNEPFLGTGLFDQLKLRVGWGQVGNQEFPAGSAQARFAVGDQGDVSQANVDNPELQWETSTTFNVGVDFALFDYKLTGTVEYFNRQTEDLLFNFEAIQPAPATRFWVNLPGNVLNDGVELSLNGFLVDNERVSWQLGGNVAFLNNELRDYNGPIVETGAIFGQGVTGARVQRLENGQPLNAFFVRDWQRIGEDGLDVLVDDGNTSFFLGDPNPDVLLGINTSVRFGRFNLIANFNGAFGHQIYNNTANTVLPIGNLGSRNIDAALLDSENQESIANSVKTSDRYLEDADYLRFTNATLSYDFGNLGNTIRNLRVFVTGQNLFVLTDYSGFDPEINTVNVVDGVPSFGIEYVPYPTPRNILFGVNFSL